MKEIHNSIDIVYSVTTSMISVFYDNWMSTCKVTVAGDNNADQSHAFTSRIKVFNYSARQKNKQKKKFLSSHANRRWPYV